MKFIKKTLTICALIAATIYLVRVVDSLYMMPLSIEHQVELDSEFRSGDEMTWNEYRENEERIEEEFMSTPSSIPTSILPRRCRWSTP